MVAGNKDDFGFCKYNEIFGKWQWYRYNKSFHSVAARQLSQHTTHQLPTFGIISLTEKTIQIRMLHVPVLRLPRYECVCVNKALCVLRRNEWDFECAYYMCVLEVMYVKVCVRSPAMSLSCWTKGCAATQIYQCRLPFPALISYTCKQAEVRCVLGWYENLRTTRKKLNSATPKP